MENTTRRHPSSFLPRMQKKVDSNPFLSFMDAVLRGAGQVLFQNSPLSGVLLFAGTFYSSPALGGYALLGTVVSTGTACLLGLEPAEIRSGHYGFNGALAAVALGVYFPPDPSGHGYLLAASAASTLLMAAFRRFPGRWGIPPLTAPYLLTIWIVFLAGPQFPPLAPGMSSGRLAEAMLAARESASGPASIFSSLCWEGAIKGLGEVMFQGTMASGVIFLAALAVNSRPGCLWALAGAFLGTVTARVFGVDESLLRAGLFGYCPALTAIVLGSGIFVPRSWRNSLLTLPAIVFTSLFQVVTADRLASLGLPLLSCPFVLVTWIFLAALPYPKSARGLDK
jgi:urea transporter